MRPIEAMKEEIRQALTNSEQLSGSAKESMVEEIAVGYGWVIASWWGSRPIGSLETTYSFGFKPMKRLSLRIDV